MTAPHQRRIFLLDDEIPALRPVIRRLEQEFFVSAPSARLPKGSTLAEGFQRFQAGHTPQPFDLALIDISIPTKLETLPEKLQDSSLPRILGDFYGYLFAAWLEKEAPTLPVAYYTVYNKSIVSQNGLRTNSLVETINKRAEGSTANICKTIRGILNQHTQQK